MLAVRAIAEAEQITVSNEEVDAEYARLAWLHGNPEEEIRKVLSRDAVAAAVTNQKVQRFLLDHAALTSVVEKENRMGFFTRAAMDALMKTTHPEINRRQCWNLHPHRKACTTCKDICLYGEEIFPARTLSRTGDPAPTAGCAFRMPQWLHCLPRRSRCSGDTAAADTDSDTI